MDVLLSGGLGWLQPYYCDDIISRFAGFEKGDAPGGGNWRTMGMANQQDDADFAVLQDILQKNV